MENIKIVEIENPLDGSKTEHIIIDRGNDQFTSMPKAVWDEQQKAAEQGGTL